MEAIIQNIPAVISIILPVVLALVIVTNIIVDVLKGLTWKKLPTNVLAFLVAMAVTLVAFSPCARSPASRSHGTWWSAPSSWASSSASPLCMGSIS